MPLLDLTLRKRCGRHESNSFLHAVKKTSLYTLFLLFLAVYRGIVSTASRKALRTARPRQRSCASFSAFGRRIGIKKVEANAKGLRMGLVNEPPGRFLPGTWNFL